MVFFYFLGIRLIFAEMVLGLGLDSCRLIFMVDFGVRKMSHAFGMELGVMALWEFMKLAEEVTE